MAEKEYDALVRQVGESLVGVERMLDVKMPHPTQLSVPRDETEKAALVELVSAIDQLHRAVENYQIAIGKWHGKPKIAIAWVTLPASGPEPMRLPNGEPDVHA